MTTGDLLNIGFSLKGTGELQAPNSRVTFRMYDDRTHWEIRIDPQKSMRKAVALRVPLDALRLA
jgi:hypothetical protein